MQLAATDSAVDHPAWCSPAHCDAAAGHADVRHSAAPETWIAAAEDVELQVALHRDDFATGEPVHGVTLRLQDLGMSNEDGSSMRASVLLTEPDMCRIEAVFARFREVSAG